MSQNPQETTVTSSATPTTSVDAVQGHRIRRWPARTVGLARVAGVTAAVVALVGAGLGAAPSSAAGGGVDPTVSAPAVTQSACSTTRPGQARCLAQGRVDAAARSATHASNVATRRATLAGKARSLSTAATLPPGLGAVKLRSAYAIPKTSSTATVAVVIAGDVPNAEADLAVYRSTFGLPPCTTANSCFRKVNQKGKARPLPFADPGWALEGSMDLQMVSAACPTCRILLVEGDEPSLEALGAATDTARRLGASVASHSYGADESAQVRPFARAYRPGGMVNVVSSGDWGFTTASFPAVVPGVVAVGGTTLRAKPSTARGWTEKVWSGAGSGCSAWFAKPSFQKDPHCQMRTVSDISAVADPQTGVAVYDSWENPFGEEPGWFVLGGTSASAPLVAGMIGAAGSGRTFRNGMAYSRTKWVNDVVGGTNGFCGGDYLCKGVVGYDAPSGVGTPKGLRVFTG